MDFRWIAVIALWTILSGPVFHSSLGQPRAAHHVSNPTAASSGVER
jgi:hypothetical protein